MFTYEMTLHYVLIFCYKNIYRYILKIYIKMNNDTMDDLWQYDAMT